jgi:hypothetical protein
VLHPNGHRSRRATAKSYLEQDTVDRGRQRALEGRKITDAELRGQATDRIVQAGDHLRGVTAP